MGKLETNYYKSDEKDTEVNTTKPATVSFSKSVNNSLTNTQIADIFCNSIIESQQLSVFEDKKNFSMSNSQLANLFSSSGTSFSFVESSPIKPQKESTPVIRPKKSN